jgi:hypothetical protein
MGETLLQVTWFIHFMDTLGTSDTLVALNLWGMEWQSACVTRVECYRNNNENDEPEGVF